jgi:hypothetical protein
MSPIKADIIVVVTLAMILLGYAVWKIGSQLYVLGGWLKTIAMHLGGIDKTLQVIAQGEIAAQQRRLEAENLRRIREQIAAGRETTEP